MKIALGTPAMLPVQQDGVFYPGQWELIPLNSQEPLHDGFYRSIDEHGFWRLSDDSDEGVVGYDPFEQKPVYVSLYDIIGLQLQVWVEDIKRRPAVRSQLARVYTNGATAVARIHPIQFHRILQLRQMPPDSVWIGVTCLTTGASYSWPWEGELRIPPEDELERHAVRPILL